jgi:hypothetical protein
MTTIRRRHPTGRHNNNNHHNDDFFSNNNSVDWRSVSKWMAEAANIYFDLDSIDSSTWQKKVFHAVEEEILLHAGSTTIRSFCLPPVNMVTTNPASLYFSATTKSNPQHQHHSPTIFSSTYHQHQNTFSAMTMTNTMNQQNNSNELRTLYLCIDLDAANDWVAPPPERITRYGNNHHNNMHHGGATIMTSRAVSARNNQPRSILKQSQPNLSSEGSLEFSSGGGSGNAFGNASPQWWSHSSCNDFSCK